MVLLTVCVIGREWLPGSFVGEASPWLALACLVLLVPSATVTGIAFVVVGLVLTAILATNGPDFVAVVTEGLALAAFIGAFFAALNTLRSAAQTSPAIHRCGAYLAHQPPGRRYGVLTLGGAAFSLVLNYGSIALLGSLATASAAEEKDPVIRPLRQRRMLVAVQRAFLAVLPWSPLSFAGAVTASLVPGSTYVGVLLPCIGTGVLIAGTGWALDTIFKPRVAVRRPVERVGGPRDLKPLVILLVLMGTLILSLHFEFGVRVVGVVLLLVPLVSLGWLVIQGGPASLGPRVRTYVGRELPGLRSELVLLMMAGYIGKVGAALLVPLAARSGLDLGLVPGWVLLAGIVWLIPLTGMIGMNPILAASLLVPLMPAAGDDYSPTALFVATTAGWAISGATSPFTATTQLIGSFAQIPAARVGLVWNGAYAIVTGVLVTAWVIFIDVAW
ncbi:hypothetical protein FHY64_17445 [Pelagovum pacificum]|uniref:H+/citrate symporter n=1 Tax=Pelagovum pacificum TaxID=2588711 RepID=A0A5C5GBU7_9RHOB|nr:hypothetical protein I8N54_12370 [Pelagovum pacificum]TNY31067.1 hypothetical protein FHY64_17445 [Pelagovum pacificum]